MRVMQTQQGEFNKMGQSLLDAVGNAYEPMLEHHIGRPVVLELTNPSDPEKRTIELTGFLAEYSEKFVAVFNVEQDIVETFELVAVESVKRGDVKIDVRPEWLSITNLHDTPLVLSQLRSDSGECRDLGILLVNGTTAQLVKLPGKLTLQLQRVQRIDVICPRTNATIRHASLSEMPSQPERNLPPAQEDPQVGFP